MPGPNTDGTPSIATPLYNAHSTVGKRPLESTTTDPTNRGVHPHPSVHAPAANAGGNPLTATPSSDLNTNSRKPQSSSTATATSTRSDAQLDHRSSQMSGANTGGNPLTTTPASDPNMNLRRPQSSTMTTTSTRDAEAAHRSSQMPAANAGETPSTAHPQHDGNSSSRKHNSSTTGTTNRGVHPHQSVQDAHHGTSEDQGKGSSGSKKPSRYTDQGGQRTQGDEGEHKANVLKKPPPARSTRAGERKESQSGSSAESTGTHSYSPTDQERRMASKASTALANVQPQSGPGSKHTSYSRALVGGKFQSANHPETGSNASDPRGSDSINSRQTQLGSKSAQSLPPGAAEAHPPTANRHRETQPGEDASTDDHSTQPPVHVVVDSSDDSTQGDDEGPDGSHPQLPGGLSTEGGQHVQGEGGEVHIAQPSGYLAGIRNIAGSFLGPAGQAQPPRDKTKEELQRTKARLQQLEYDFRRARGDNANLHRAYMEADSENRRNKDTIRSLQHEISNMGRELQEYKNLSEIRGRELLGAQVFLTKADLLSISDVKDKVNALNDENFQASASLGDALVHFKYELANEEWETAYAQVCRTVSEPLAYALRKETQKPEPEVNPLLVQVVLEMYLVHFCSSLIESWFPQTRETSDFLSTIYSEIRRTGEFIFVRYRLPLIPIFRGTGCLR